MVSELTKTLKITHEQVCIMAALLGNFLLPESELQDLYKKLNLAKVTAETVSIAIFMNEFATYKMCNSCK